MDSKNPKRHLQGYIIGIIVLWLIYAALTIMASDTQAVSRYRLSHEEANLLRITVVLPFLFIWTSAVFAAAKFSHYTRLVAQSPEEKSFKNVTVGLWLLLAVLIVPQFISRIFAFNPDPQEGQKSVTIITNYVSIALYLAAFWHIFKASLSLKDMLEDGNQVKTRNVVVLALITILSLAYIAFVFNNEFRQASSDPLVRPTYFLPDILIFSTIIIPHIIIWALGSLAISNMYFFAKRTSGVVYRKVFSYVSHGLALIILLSMALQLVSQAGAFFGRAGLGIILIVVYLILIAIAAGYLLIAKGARKLTQIEEA
jgi:hypothetical protein